MSEHKVFGEKTDGRYYERPGAYFIPFSDGFVTLVSTPKGLFLIGGGIEDGEGDKDCIIRECMEETGCTARPTSFLCSAEYYCVHPRVGLFHPVQRYYLGDISAPVTAEHEADHKLVRLSFEEALPGMYLDMQRWAVERCAVLHAGTDAPTLMWDLDGTLLDSYGSIVDCLYRTMLEYGVTADRAEIYNYTKLRSVMGFIDEAGARYGFDSAAAKQRYSEIHEQDKLGIRLMPGAAEALAELDRIGVVNLVFTHRGPSADAILENTGIKKYFRETVNGRDGFARKPSPEAIDYLVASYGLDRKRTFYVGDRSLDIDGAVNAGIGSILYLPSPIPGLPTGKETHVITDLRDTAKIILDIL